MKGIKQKENVKQRQGMLGRHHHWLPVVLAVYLPISFIVTYAIAVSSGHVKPGFPYISDTGTFPPESCVFGQLLNVGAVLCGIIMYIRFRHVETMFGKSPRILRLRHLNLASFIIGMITVFGVSVVGNFQETSVIVVHLIGAFLAFGIGFVYCLLQTIMSFKMDDEMPGNSKYIRRIRVALCTVNVILLLVLFVSTPVAGGKGPRDGVAHYNWTAHDPGYAEHLVSTVSEWLIAVIDVLFFATFYTEFKHFKICSPEIIFYDSDTLQEAIPSISPNGIAPSLPT